MKTYFVTGASSGLGREICFQLVEQGNHVYGVGRDRSRLEDLSESLGNSPGKFSYQAFDLRDHEALTESISAAVKLFNKIDVVIVNAGYYHMGEFAKQDWKQIEMVIDVNLIASIKLIHLAIPLLTESHGQLVISGSIDTETRQPYRQVYCLSKVALKNLAFSLHHELKERKISVTLMTLGVLDTFMRRRSPTGEYDPCMKEIAPEWLMVSPQVAAKEFIHEMKKRKKVSIITAHAKLIRVISFFSPSTIYWLHRIAYNLKALRASKQTPPEDS